MTCDDGLVKGFFAHDRQGISRVKASHAVPAVSAWFDGANLIADAGLLAVVRLADWTRPLWCAGPVR